MKALALLAAALLASVAGCATPLGESEVTLDALTFTLTPQAGGATTEFRADASRAHAAGLATTIDWGDGATTPGPTASHRYGFTNGAVTVTLHATDPTTGREASATRGLTLGTGVNAPPRTSLTASAEWIEVAEIVGLEATHANDPDGDPLTYFWSYLATPRGDAHGHEHASDAQSAPIEIALPAAGRATTHAFDAPGEYEVRVRALDPKGGEAIASRKILVTEVIPSSSFSQDFEGTLTAGTAGAGAANALRSATGEETSLDSAAYAFRLPYPGNLTLALAWTDATGAADLDLLLTDYATGEVLARAETRDSGGAEGIGITLPAASYGIIVIAFAGANVPFTLAARADLIVTPESVAAAAGEGG